MKILLLNLAALGNVTVRTYLDGVSSEEFTGNNLVANVSFAGSSGRFKLVSLAQNVRRSKTSIKLQVLV
jgi:hypothetical protein